MESSHHVNWNSIIYREGAIHKTETGRPFVAAQGFDINLVHFLQPYHFSVRNMHVCSFIGTISHMNGRAPKTILHAQNLVYKKIVIYEGLILDLAKTVWDMRILWQKSTRNYGMKELWALENHIMYLWICYFDPVISQSYIFWTCFITWRGTGY